MNESIVTQTKLFKCQPLTIDGSSGIIWLTSFAERPTTTIGRINGHWVNETRDEITGSQIND